MFPVLFSIGNFSISTFGVFLSLSFLYGLFLIWRLARGWELDEEKVLDLTLVTFVGGLIGARIYFVLENPATLLSLTKIILITKYPGFSFWGGILGGFFTLSLISKRFKIEFWQSLDIASVGFLGGLILTNIGCFLGGCNVGILSNLFFALPASGFIGKRIPISLMEALLLLIFLKKVWSEAIHFHPRGKILSLTLIFIGISRLITEPFREVKDSLFFAPILIILGLVIIYKVTKRNFLLDLKSIFIFPNKIILDSKYRHIMVVSIKKNWYNQIINFRLKLNNLIKKVGRLNVRFSHKNSKYY